ncbi:MAG TPA: hypothetical protein VFB50_03025 [Chloroflexota bacterium]|nr:hypothetical protein [Chloroflexota bacterium]
MKPTVWNGTPSELQRLLASVERNCTCAAGAEAPDSRMCSLHRALSFDQSFVDRQIYARRMHERLLCEEWLVDAG